MTEQPRHVPGSFPSPLNLSSRSLKHPNVASLFPSVSLFSGAGKAGLTALTPDGKVRDIKEAARAAWIIDGGEHE